MVASYMGVRSGAKWTFPPGNWD